MFPSFWKWLIRRPRAMKQYARDRLKHRDYHDEIDEEHRRFFQALDDAEAMPSPLPVEFPELIEDLLSHDRFRVGIAESRLKKVAAQAEEELLAALEDPRAVWTKDQAQSVESSPAERVTSLLERIPSRELGRRIGHLVDHPDWRVHNVAIESRCALGRADDLPFVLGKLAEQTQSAETGVERGLAQGWAEPAFIDGLRKWAERTTRDSSLPFSYWAVEFYANQGGPAAIEYLRSPEVLSVANDRHVHAVLKQLNTHGVRLEACLIRPLLDKAFAEPEAWPWNCLFEDALRALAVTEPDEAMRIAGDHLDGNSSRYRSGAIDFIQESSGLPRVYQIDPPPEMTLSEAEMQCLDAMAECREVFGQVCNGNLSQYFFNSSGDDWPKHVAALRTIGFEVGAATIEKASKLLDPNGASLDRNTRIAQHASLSERTEKQLDEWSQLFYSDVPRLRFMLQHKELFVRLRKARKAAGLDSEA